MPSAILTDSMIRREAAWLLREQSARGIYFSVQKKIGENELTIASGGELRRLRFGEAARLLSIKEFNRRYLQPLVNALKEHA